MLTYSELKSKCRKAMVSTPLERDEEVVSILYQNDWVRILTVRESNNLETCRIEIELSLPSQTYSESGDDVKAFVQNLIKHLEYLLRLENQGLTLGVISREGLWTAYLDIEDVPDDNLFRALIPPSV